jgi:Bacterial Ig domain/S-layer homology domain
MEVLNQKVLKISVVIGLMFSLIIQPLIPGVYAANADSTPPELESYEISPQEVNVGETVTVRAKIKDDISGIKSAYVSYRLPSSNRSQAIYLTYKPEEGIWEGSYTIQSTDEGGVWSVYYTSLADYAGNKVLIDGSDGVTSNRNQTNIFVNNQSGDSTPPELESYELRPQEVNVGDTVTVRAKINDNISGIKSAYVSYQSPSKNRSQAIYLTYKPEEGIWEGSYTIKPTDEGGTWSVYYTSLADFAGNKVLIDGSEGVTSNRVETNIFVNNQNGDSTPPELESYEISPQEVNVGDTVTVRARIKDDISGIKSAYVSYQSPSKNRSQAIYLTYKPVEGIWEGSYTIKPTDEGGTWSVYYTSLADYAGNKVLIDGSEGVTSNRDETNILVNNQIGDSTPPELESYEISPQEVNVGDTVTVRAKIKDDISGIKSAYVSYQSPSKNRSQAIYLTYKPVEGIWEGSYTVKSTDERGTWSVYYTSLADFAGNKVLIDGSEGITSNRELTNIYVNNPPVDTIPPQTASVNEVNDKSMNITGTAESGSTVSIKVATEEIGSAIAGDNGTFNISIPLQKAGTNLSIIATDEAGNSSEPKNITVKDITSPVAPKVNEVTDLSTIITGTAEAGSKVSIKAGTEELGTTVVKEDGTFNITIPLQKAGEKLTVTATDQAGNESEIQEVVVKDVTSPEAPVVKEVSDYSTEITGTAEAETTVSVKAGTKELGSTVVKEDGSFKIIIPVQLAGIKLTVIATDEAGNQSESLEIAVKDTTPPELPIVTEVTNQTSIITGIAETGSTVSVQNETGELGSSTVGEDGQFSISIPPQTVETKLIVKASDYAGNQSDLQEIIVKRAAQPQKFTDINGHWAENEINKLYELGLVKGYTDGSFGVSNKITRAEVASIISRHLNLTGTPSTFSDVPSNYWASNVIGAIQTNKIMSGYNDGTFKPNAPITRAEIASIIERAYDLKGEGEIGFTDVHSTHWAYKPISVLLFNNLTSGFGNNTFRPNAELSRSEFAAFLSRVISLNP